MNEKTNEIIKDFIKETKKIKYEDVTQHISDYDNDKKVLIEIRGLKKTFGNKKNKNEVLKGIDLKIQENENIAILGSNGCGKTTLIEIVAGLNKVTEGEIIHCFHSQNDYLKNIGIQFQDSSYPPGITTQEVIKFVVGVYEAHINEEELNGLIKIFGINEYIKKSASSLSGGQQQRLNALLAILHKPKIVFLDELSTGLDITIRTRIKKFLKEYTKDNNMTICIVSHDMEEVQYLADRIIVLVDGRIVVNASKESILSEYGTLEAFIDNYI